MWDDGPLLSRNAISEAFLYDDPLPPPLGIAALLARFAGFLRDKRRSVAPAVPREALASA